MGNFFEEVLDNVTEVEEELLEEIGNREAKMGRQLEESGEFLRIAPSRC